MADVFPTCLDVSPVKAKAVVFCGLRLWVMTDMASDPNPYLQSGGLGESFNILSEKVCVEFLVQSLRYSKHLLLIIIDHIIFNSGRSNCTILGVGLIYGNIFWIND